MRVSTALVSQTSLNAMLDQQKKLNNTQLKVSTGKKLLVPSDDPYGWCVPWIYRKQLV